MKTSKILLLLTIIVVIFSGCDLLMSDANAVEADKNYLTIGYSVPDNADHVTKNLKLDAKGVNGSSIGWQSSNPNVIDIHGAVTRPADADSTVTMTATISKGSALATKAFIVTVKASSQVTFQIGDTGPAGGLIFYIDEDNDFDWTYLEAAPAGWDGAEDPQFVWGGYGIEVSITEEGIGKGKNNTEIIVTTIGEGSYAAKACDDYTVTVDGITFTDWYLPSEEELSEMYNNLHQDEMVGGFGPYSYWSSSQDSFDSENNAMRISFSSDPSDGGNIGISSKNTTLRVRPIRSF